MGTTSNVEQNNEQKKEPQTFNINININSSNNPSTDASLNQNYLNNISLKEGDASPIPFSNNPINSYNNKNNNISINIEQNGAKISINNLNNNISNKINNNKEEEKSSNVNIDPNIGEYKNQENKGKSTEGNIDPNKGGQQKKYEIQKPDKTPENKGNINMFSGGNQRVNEKEETTKDVYVKPKKDYNIDNNIEENEKIFTNTGNDISYLPKEKKENTVKNEKKTVTPSPDGNKDNKDNNASHSKDNKIYDVLSVSLTNINATLLKEEVAKKRDEGYFPLFLKIDNNKPKFFFIKFDSTLRCLIKTYKMMMGIDDLKIEYNLYNDKNELLDQDIEINYLNIEPLKVISNHPN